MGRRHCDHCDSRAIDRKGAGGLEIASDASPLQADVTTIAMMASRNLYEALQRFSRLSQIVTDSVQVVLTREGQELRLDVIVKSSERQFMPPEAMDSALLIPLSLLGKGMIVPGAQAGSAKEVQ